MEIQVTEGNGFTLLRQEGLDGVETVVLTTKQFAQVASFLIHSKSKTFRASGDSVGDVFVCISNDDGEFTLTQDDFTLFGNRSRENCGFSGVTLWMHPKQSHGDVEMDPSTEWVTS